MADTIHPVDAAIEALQDAANHPEYSYAIEFGNLNVPKAIEGLTAYRAGMGEPTPPAPTREEAINETTRAITKARFYDCEPEAYESLEAFWIELDPDHWLDAQAEATAAYDALLAMGAIRELRTVVEQIHDVTDAIMAGNEKAPGDEAEG